MAEAEWTRIAFEVAGWACSSLIGLLFGAWRAGRKSAHKEQETKDDYDGKINALREKTRQDVAKYEQQASARNDLLIEQFKESFEGIRRQIDQNKFDAEVRFLPKDDFKEFRQEWREGMTRIFDRLDNLPSSRARQ